MNKKYVEKKLYSTNQLSQRLNRLTQEQPSQPRRRKEQRSRTHQQHQQPHHALPTRKGRIHQEHRTHHTPRTQRSTQRIVPTVQEVQPHTNGTHQNWHQKPTRPDPHPGNQTLPAPTHQQTRRPQQLLAKTLPPLLHSSTTIPVTTATHQQPSGIADQQVNWLPLKQQTIKQITKTNHQQRDQQTHHQHPTQRGPSHPQIATPGTRRE